MHEFYDAWGVLLTKVWEPTQFEMVKSMQQNISISLKSTSRHFPNTTALPG